MDKAERKIRATFGDQQCAISDAKTLELSIMNMIVDAQKKQFKKQVQSRQLTAFKLS